MNFLDSPLVHNFGSTLQPCSHLCSIGEVTEIKPATLFFLPFPSFLPPSWPILFISSPMHCQSLPLYWPFLFCLKTSLCLLYTHIYTLVFLSLPWLRWPLSSNSMRKMGHIQSPFSDIKNHKFTNPGLLRSHGLEPYGWDLHNGRRRNKTQVSYSFSIFNANDHSMPIVTLKMASFSEGHHSKFLFCVWSTETASYMEQSC